MSENNYDENYIILEDEDTNEQIKMVFADTFELNGKTYDVLVTDEEDESKMEMVIMEEVQDGDEMFLKSIPEEEEDIIYDYYDDLCEEIYDDEDESEE